MKERLKNFFNRHKSKLAAVFIGAVAAMSMAIVAGAEETDTMSAVIANAGTQIQGSLSDLVQAVVPVVLSVFGVGLVIFGIMWLVRTVKKVFTKSAN